MSTTGLRVFDETLHATNTWLHEITSRMGWDEREKGYRLLRLCLHAIRDRMPVGEAAHLSAQLPLLLRGVFFEGWRPAKVPLPIHTVDEFLAPLRKGFASERHFDPRGRLPRGGRRHADACQRRRDGGCPPRHAGGAEAPLGRGRLARPLKDPHAIA